MNALHQNPILGLPGAGAPGAPGQTLESLDGAFAEQLSAVLSGAVMQPTLPLANPVSAGAGALSLALLSNQEQETASPLSLLGEGGLNLDASLAGFLQGGQGGSLGAAASGDILIGSELAAAPAAGAGQNAKVGLPGQPAPGAAGGLASASLQAGLSADASVLSSTDASGLSKAASDAATGQTSGEAPVNPSIALLASDAEPVIVQGQSLQQQRLAERKPGDRQGVEPGLADKIGRRGLGAVTDSPIAAPSPGRQQPSSTPQARLDRQALAAQQAGGTVEDVLSNADHLAQVRSQTAILQHGGDNPAAFRQTATASLAPQQAAPVEALAGDVLTDGGSVEIFSTEPGRLDPVGSTAAKAAAQPSQQPAAMQIALQIARAAPQGIDRFSVQLHPADLGAVEIRLDIAEDGQLTASIIAERQDTLDMLQRDSRALERSLNETGLRLDNDGLSFSLKQDQHQQQGQGFHASSQQQSSAYANRQSEEGPGNDSVLGEPVRIGQQRLLDIRT